MLAGADLIFHPACSEISSFQTWQALLPIVECKAGLCQGIKFLTGIADNGVTTHKCAAAHGPRSVTGLKTTKMPTAAPLQR